MAVKRKSATVIKSDSHSHSDVLNSELQVNY